MDELIVEPVGGFTGMGSNPNVTSEGRISVSALSQEDRAKVNALFENPQSAPSNFYYRITKKGPSSTKSVNVSAELVPAALTGSVKTELR